MMKSFGISPILMDFFYRRFRGSTYFCTPHATKSDAFSSNLTIPLSNFLGVSQILHLRHPFYCQKNVKMHKVGIINLYKGENLFQFPKNRLTKIKFLCIINNNNSML